MYRGKTHSRNRKRMEKSWIHMRRWVSLFENIFILTVEINFINKVREAEECLPMMVLTHGTWKCYLIWESVFADVIKLKILRWDH